MASPEPDAGAQARAWPAFSVVVPARNEAGNLPPLIAEIAEVMDRFGLYEIVVVDDGSDDGTAGVLDAEAKARPALRPVRHAKPAGQSAALLTGVKAARGVIIVTLDGDGQNDPADIPKLVDRFFGEDDHERLLVTGQRKKRMDSWAKRAASKIANAIRGGLLGDGTPDTGCGLKVVHRQTYLDLPAFDHMHRFLPALVIRTGGRVISVPVNHRPRAHGRTNYGVAGRALAGIVDLVGVMWLQRRRMIPDAAMPEPAPVPASAPAANGKPKPEAKAAPKAKTAAKKKPKSKAKAKARPKGPAKA